MTFGKICENPIMDSRIQYSNDIKELSKVILGTMLGQYTRPIAEKLHPIEPSVKKSMATK